MNGRVDVSVQDGLAVMRLTRADGGNAIDPAWVTAFGEAVAACEGARAVLICANGPAFTVGGDLKHFKSRIDDLGDALDEMVPGFHAALGTLATLPAPVVCALQGPIAGGGLGLALCADIVLAAPSVQFVCGFSLLGLSGDGGGSWWLPRLVGPRRAAEMMLLNRRVSAEDAFDWGLVTRIVPASELETEALSVARRLAAGPTVSFGHMKRLLRESWNASLRDQLEAETAAMIACGSTADAREGVDAFSGRRSPRFKGD